MPLPTEVERDATASRADTYASREPAAADLFLLVATSALLIARVPLIFVRAFDNDEFEHCHAAWSVFRGMLPYKDFFEHHTPWYYFALSPFFRWFAVDGSFDSARHFLIFGRLVSLALTAVSVTLIYLVGRLGSNRRVGLLAALFLAGEPVVIHKTLEIRPDVPALALFIASLWFLQQGLLVPEAPRPRQLRWFWGAGLCLGAAIMHTQKMLFAVPGMLAGLGLWTLAESRRLLHRRIFAVLVLLLGVTLPGFVTWLAFARRGGGGLFIYDNFILNAHWQWRSSRNLQLVLKNSAPILCLCLVGASLALRRSARAARTYFSDATFLCALAGLVAGLLVVPAAYEQYDLPGLAIACLFAARGLSLLVTFIGHRSRSRWLVYATVAFLIYPVFDLARAFGRRNDVQMARLQFVFAHTGPTDPVLDGWLGTDVFRPHPHYYFFMHRELQVSLTERERNAYVEALTSGRIRPALITLDDELRALGSPFVEFVQRSYTSRYGLFYFPNQSEPSGAALERRAR